MAAMPTLKNPRHERFAQLLASGKTAKDAYALAGYKPSESNGAWLAHKEEISSRVAEINNQAIAREQKASAIAAERCAITKQSLTEMALDIYKQAKRDGQNAAAMAAVKEIGVLTGIRIERRESGQPGEFAELENMTADELRAFIAGKLDIESYRQAQSSQAVN
jgi:hypothetical protein